MTLFLIILVLCLLFPDFYIWWNFTRGQSGLWRTLLVCLPTLVIVGSIVLMFCQVRLVTLMQIAFIVVVCVAIPKLVFVLVDLLGRGIVWGHADWLPMVHRVAVFLAAAMACVQIYGTVWGWQRIVVAPQSVKVHGLPAAFDGYQVVQISDLHLGTYVGETSFVEEVVDSVNSLNPDLIVFTGDLVNNYPDELTPYLPVLSRLKARDGVISILGNHDYCMFQTGLTPAEQRKETARLVQMQEQMGWKVLRNAHEAVVRGDDTLYVAGVDNTGKPPFPKLGNLSKALAQIPDSACTILLSHDPWHWRHGVVGESPVALTLSGHTHALQMQIGHFSPAAWFMPEWGGLYREGDQQLFVSTGIGGRVPYRLGAWPKIERLTLKK